MGKGILGKKIGMTMIFDEAGTAVPVTVIDTSGCLITQKKSKDSDGYSALQLGFESFKLNNARKSQVGLFKKIGSQPLRRLKEVRVGSDEEIAHVKPGEPVSSTMFLKGDRVDVMGVTRGKGFQGVVKRFGFHGADASHGVHEYFRHGGSSGTNTFPGKVLKNHGMPGRTGGANCTVHNVLVAEVRAKENLILLRGAVPGPRNGMVMVATTLKSPAPEGRCWTASA